VIFFCISDTLVPTTYLVDTTLSDASDYDQTVHAVRLPICDGYGIYESDYCNATAIPVPSDFCGDPKTLKVGSLASAGS
ncbi:hypothetical protein, partial [Enterobacter sp. 262D3]|uniref:hypothetical protein n=1 Tax=Enterobacter sp. 262D3 TaxID=3077763 RepID=UPI002A80FCB2